MKIKKKTSLGRGHTPSPPLTSPTHGLRLLEAPALFSQTDTLLIIDMSVTGQ